MQCIHFGCLSPFIFFPSSSVILSITKNRERHFHHYESALQTIVFQQVCTSEEVKQVFCQPLKNEVQEISSFIFSFPK